VLPSAIGTTAPEQSRRGFDYLEDALLTSRNPSGHVWEFMLPTSLR